MRTTKQQRQTNLAEMVETHNIALSIKRLSAAPYDANRWRRALYHALSIGDQVNSAALTKIREALELP